MTILTCERDSKVRSRCLSEKALFPGSIGKYAKKRVGLKWTGAGWFTVSLQETITRND